MGYTGFTYRIPLSRGQTGQTNHTQKFPGDLDVAKNITLFDFNIQRDLGEEVVKTGLSGNIRAGIDYYPTTNSQRTIIYTTDGKLQKESGFGSGTFSDLKTGLDGSLRGVFVEGGAEFGSRDRKLFWFNGFDKPQVLNADEGSTERLGFRASLTNALDTDTGGGSGYPADAVKVAYTDHNFQAGDTITLVGFSNVGSIDPNDEAASVTGVIDDDNFYFTPTNTPTSSETNGGGTGKIYAHPADWSGNTQPAGGTIHDRRLVTFLRHQIYISTILDHTVFEAQTADGVDDVFDLQVYPDLGSEIKGSVSLFGRLFILKNPNGIVQILNPTSEFPELKVISNQLGVAGPNAFKEVEGDVIFISQYGSIHSLLAVDSTDEIRSSSISGRFFFDRIIRDNVNFSQLDKAVVEYDATNRVVWCTYPSTNSTENDFVIKVDVNEPGNPKLTTTERGTYISIWNQKDGINQFRLASGNDEAELVQLNDPQRSDKSGGVFESKFQTAFTDFQDQYPESGNLNKQVDFLEFVLEPDDTDVTITINIYADGNLRQTHNLDFQTAIQEFPLTFPVTFASEFPRNFSIPLRSVYGRRISTEFIVNSVDQNFKISELVYKFRRGDDRIL